MRRGLRESPRLNGETAPSSFPRQQEGEGGQLLFRCWPFSYDTNEAAQPILGEEGSPSCVHALNW